MSFCTYYHRRICAKISGIDKTSFYAWDASQFQPKLTDCDLVIIDSVIASFPSITLTYRITIPEVTNEIHLWLCTLECITTIESEYPGIDP